MVQQGLIMRKIIFIILIISVYTTSSVYAKHIEANYEVSYGILGKIGVAKATLITKDKHYTITVELATTGLAKLLSASRKEKHISKGHIENGLLVSDLYQVIKSHGDTVVSKEYWIDHVKKSVTKKYIKYQNGLVVTRRTQKLTYYARNDLLTLYFNLKTAIHDKTKAATYTFGAIGAERQKGKVTVIVPSKDKRTAYQKLLGDDASWYATAIIYQKVFSSKEGRLMLAIAKDGITDKAVLKDVIFFGDIRAARMKSVP